MVIVCSHCSTKFKVADDKVQKGAFKVRCSKCKNVFRVPAAEEGQKSEVAASISSSDVSLDFDIGSDALEIPKPAAKSPAKPAPAPAPVAPAASPAPDDAGVSLDFDFGSSGMELSAEDVFEKPQKTNSLPPPPQPPPNMPAFSPAAKLDDGLDKLLQGDTSSVPLHMPEDVDLESLARPSSSGRSSAASLRTTTDDGIELIDGPSLSLRPTPAAPRIDTPFVAPPLAAPPSSPSRDPMDDLMGLGEDPAPQPEIKMPAEKPRARPAAGETRASSKASASRSAPLTLRQPESKAKSSGVLAWLLIVTLLGGGGYYAWSTGLLKTFVVGKSATPVTAPSGAASSERLLIRNTNTAIVANLDNRPVLVISGEVVNQYPTARSFIKVKAQIFSAQGKRMAEKEAWAGNQFGRDEIYHFTDQDSIERAFSNAGKGLSNMNVAPQGVLPFQILILDPPREWDQFEVVAAASQPAAGY